jgi:hypothetical protein
MPVPSLKQQIDTPAKREALIDDSLKVLDQEVEDKSGLSGLAIKGAFKVVKGVQPGFLRKVVDALLDDFLDCLDAIYQEALRLGKPPGEHLKANPGGVADALLAITDARAARAERAVVKKTYGKLRPTAKRHVEAAAPRLGALLERHAQASGPTD